MDELQLQTEADKQIAFLRTQRYAIGVWIWRDANGETKAVMATAVPHAEGCGEGRVALLAFGACR